MNDQEETFKLSKFNGKTDDFSLWSMPMETVLEAKDLFGVVTGEEVKPDQGAKLIEYQKKVRKARALLINCLGDRPLLAVQSAKDNLPGMWKKLQEGYATSSSASRIQLQKLLHTKKLKPKESMAEFIDSFESVFARLEGMSAKVDENMQIAILLASLSSEKEYESVISDRKSVV